MPTYPHQADQRVTAGFTLLELLVALGIMAVILGAVLPAINSRLETARLIETVESVAESIRQAPLEARLSGRSMTFGSDDRDSGQLAALPSAPGWVVFHRRALTVSPNGLCSPGEIVVQAPSGRQRVIRVSAPFCEVRVLSPDTNEG